MAAAVQAQPAHPNPEDEIEWSAEVKQLILFTEAATQLCKRLEKITDDQLSPKQLQVCERELAHLGRLANPDNPVNTNTLQHLHGRITFLLNSKSIHHLIHLHDQRRKFCTYFGYDWGRLHANSPQHCLRFLSAHLPYPLSQQLIANGKKSFQFPQPLNLERVELISLPLPSPHLKQTNPFLSVLSADSLKQRDRTGMLFLLRDQSFAAIVQKDGQVLIFDPFYGRLALFSDIHNAAAHLEMVLFYLPLLPNGSNQERYNTVTIELVELPEKQQEPTPQDEEKEVRKITPPPSPSPKKQKPPVLLVLEELQRANAHGNETKTKAAFNSLKEKHTATYQVFWRNLREQYVIDRKISNSQFEERHIQKTSTDYDFFELCAQRIRKKAIEFTIASLTKK